MILSRIRSRISGIILQSTGITSTAQIRCLYTGEELGVKRYEESRKEVEHAIANHAFFKQQFRKQILNTETSLTHIEYGLKNLLHILSNTYADISILKDALRTLIHKRQDVDGDKYRFDTIVLRAFHFLNIPDEAIELFEDENLGQLFTQVTGYQILLDLLYENEKYADVLRIYEDLVASGCLHKNKYVDVIVLATYYRLNTPEALEKAYELWSSMTEIGNKVQFRKSRTFVAGLALNQNQPELALSILEGETLYVSMRHIKLLAWARTSQFQEIFEMFRLLFKQHQENKKFKPFTSKAVLNDIERCIKFRGSSQDREEFQKIQEKIEAMDLTTNKTLDDLLCAPFPVLPQANIYHKKKLLS